MFVGPSPLWEQINRHEADFLGIEVYEIIESTWLGLSCCSYFAARFSRLLIIASGIAAHEFWIGFDGRSMLDLGDSFLMNNDGYHGETWKDGVRRISQGGHPLRWSRIDAVVEW